MYIYIYIYNNLYLILPQIFLFLTDSGLVEIL